MNLQNQSWALNQDGISEVIRKESPFKSSKICFVLAALITMKYGQMSGILNGKVNQLVNKY